MMVWKRIFLFKWVIFRFHVNLPGCKPTHLSKLSSSLSSSHPAQPRERSQEALAKGDDLEQALQCRKELRFIGRCLWQKMLIFWFSCSEKSYSQILTWHFWHFGLVRETIYINQFYPDLIRCGFSMSGDFRSASQSDYCTSILSFSMFCSTLFNKKHAVFFEEILHHLQDFFHQQCVFFSLQLHQDQHPKPWISSSKGFLLTQRPKAPICNLWRESRSSVPRQCLDRHILVVGDGGIFRGESIDTNMKDSKSDSYTCHETTTSK